MRKRGLTWLKAALLVASPFLLALGLTQPLIRVESFYFFTQTPSLIDIVLSLFRGGDAALAVVVALVSIAAPVLKLVGVAIAFLPREPGQGDGLAARMLPLMARWAMMDVLLVAVVIFAAKTSGLAAAFTQPGLWFYAASALSAALLHGLSQRGGAPDDPG